LKAQLTEMERQGFGKKAEQLSRSEPLKAGTIRSGVEEDTPASSNKIVLDQLRKIEGIGPKIEEILHKHGILTYKMLAEADVDRVREIVHSANPAYKVHDPATWPEQAKLADLELWDELDLLQSKLKGGKKACSPLYVNILEHSVFHLSGISQSRRTRSVIIEVSLAFKRT